MNSTCSVDLMQLLSALFDNFRLGSICPTSGPLRDSLTYVCLFEIQFSEPSSEKVTPER